MNAIVFVVLALGGQDWAVIQASPTADAPQEISWRVLPEPVAADSPPVAWDVLAIDHEPTPVVAESPRLAAVEKKLDDVMAALVSHVSATMQDAHRPLTKPPEPPPEPKPIEHPAARIEPTVQLIEMPAAMPQEQCTQGRCPPQTMRRGLFRR